MVHDSVNSLFSQKGVLQSQHCFATNVKPKFYRTRDKESANSNKQNVNGVWGCLCQRAALTKQAADKQWIRGEGSEMVRPKLCAKLIVFTSIPIVGEENVKCRAGQWASPGLAAAVLKLKWHFLSEAFRQTALFCPFTRNPLDTQTPIAKNKSGHLKHTAVIEETDSGFNTGEDSWCERAGWWRYHSKWGIHFCDIAVAAVQRGAAQSPKTLCGVYISLVQKCMPLLSCIGRKEKDWVSSVSTSRPWWNVTSTADWVGIWIVSLPR